VPRVTLTALSRYDLVPSLLKDIGRSFESFPDMGNPPSIIWCAKFDQTARYFGDLDLEMLTAYGTGRGTDDTTLEKYHKLLIKVIGRFSMDCPVAQDKYAFLGGQRTHYSAVTLSS
jgi:hypothetical protein